MLQLHDEKQPRQAEAGSTIGRIAMRQQQLRFNIKDNVEVDVDFSRRKAVINCETEDGTRISFEAKYETLEKIHQVIQAKLAV